MRLPNLLATSRGRLTAFFLLYTTEGVPLGFAATAVATQLRRMGVGPAEIGAFVASFYLPWAFKWAFGPMVDVFRSQRWGHRRAWILGTQLGMAATLLTVLWVPLPAGLALFTAILFAHNLIAATQDVAIDALAVGSLSDDERGLANGLMFAGASVGQAAGGAGVLALMDVIGLQGGIVVVAAAILAVTCFVVLPMKEAFVGDVQPDGQGAARSDLRNALVQMRGFAEQTFRSFLGARGAFAGVGLALVPAGAMSLSLALQSNLAVELGMSDDAVALQALVSTIVSGSFMVIGGWVADRLGRRRMLAVYTVLMSLPVLYLAWRLQAAGYVMPNPPGGPPQADLIVQLWIAVVAFNVALGLMYGTRTAVFMDVTNPAVAGTQFTAYMAMMNLAIALSATWQGVAAERLGYPVTLALDALIGLVGLALLPWLARSASGAQCDAAAAARARWVGWVLAGVCLVFVPWWWWHDRAGPAVGIVNTLFTLAFVATALYLYAGTLLQQAAPGTARVSRWLALAVLLLYARRWLNELPAPAQDAGSVMVTAVALAVAFGLVHMAGRPWPGLSPTPSATTETPHAA